MTSELLNDFGVPFKKAGSQYLIDCPCCGKAMHCHVAPDSGLWHCKVCGAKGNAYQLIKLFRPNMTPAEIMQTLERFGLNNKGDTGTSKPAKPSIQLRKDEFIRMEEPDIDAFCKTYEIEKLALRAIMGDFIYQHAKEPWALFQSFRPGQVRHTGIMRAHMQRKMIKTSHGDENYPQIYGSQHGLFGLARVEKDKPETVVFTEGWRDAVAATEAGYYAMASSGGASCWKDEWLPAFKKKMFMSLWMQTRPGLGQHTEQLMQSAR